MSQATPHVTQVDFEYPAKLKPIFTTPRGAVRYRACYGGRGGGRSYNFAMLALCFGAAEKLRILCCRQFQNSIKESFHAELKSALERNPWLAAHYEVGVDFLRGRNGTEFIFKGLERNVASVKSLSNVDICIVEEAENAKEESWRALEPTIRKELSEIWALWNPTFDDSPVNLRFRTAEPSNAIVVEMSYLDNPFFPSVMEDLRKRDMAMLPPQVYNHMWLGEFISDNMGEVFQWQWFREHGNFDVAAYSQIVHSWDTAYKADQHNDPSACTVWGINGNNASLLHVFNERLEYPALKKRIIALCAIYPPKTVLIEDKASGQSLIQEFRDIPNLSTAVSESPIVAINPTGDKLTRAAACCDMIASGRIFVPTVAPWLDEYRKQLVRFSFSKDFSKGNHDDMVDSTSQFINWFKEYDEDEAHRQTLLRMLGKG
jgi:PBSX family phage terminase large subunit